MTLVFYTAEWLDSAVDAWVCVYTFLNPGNWKKEKYGFAFIVNECPVYFCYLVQVCFMYTHAFSFSLYDDTN